MVSESQSQIISPLEKREEKNKKKKTEAEFKIRTQGRCVFFFLFFFSEQRQNKAKQTPAYTFVYYDLRSVSFLGHHIRSLIISKQMHALKQWMSFLAYTPGILGPACLLAKWKPQTSMTLLQTWAKTMAQVINLQVNVVDRNKVERNPLNTSSQPQAGDNSAASPCNLEQQQSHQSQSMKNKTGTLYVHLNQQTLLSVVLYSVALPFYKIVMNIEFALLPFIGWYPALLGGTTIIRQYPELAKKSLRKVVENLQKGETYCISIEGKRCGPDGQLSPYKKGPIILALESQCDIVPFLTMGELSVWPYGKWILTPGQTIDVIILPKISTKGLTMEDRHELLHRLRQLAEQEISTWQTNHRNPQ
jgi:1-acyl-sn-glycerol-3-phosphate acyltransferase